MPMSEGLTLSEYKTEMDAAQENLDRRGEVEEHRTCI
jgi:hypothetical protein